MHNIEGVTLVNPFQFTKLGSDIGGILGIFIGISAISIVEIIQLVIDIAMVIGGKNLIGKVDDVAENDKEVNEAESGNTFEMVEVKVTELDSAVEDLTITEMDEEEQPSTSSCHR